MNRSAIKPIRLALAGAVLAAAALTIQPALAADTQPPPQQRTAGWHHPDMAAHLARKLDAMGQKLHLKDNQQAAWTAYRSFIETEMKQRAEMWKQHKPGDMRNLPAPERMRKIAADMRRGADELDKMAQHTATFYKVLSPEQQTIFDLCQRDLRPHHPFGHPGMGGHPWR